MILRSPEMLLYLTFCLFNALLYTAIKLFSVNLGISTLVLASYMNLMVFILYNIFFFKRIWRNRLYFNVIKVRNLFLSASVISALTKMYCIQYIEPRDAVIIAHTTPLMVMLFASIFLKEKMIPKYWIYGALSLVGVMIYVWKKIDLNSFYYLILLLHVLFKATMHIATKNASKHSVFDVLFYDNLFYSIFAICFLSITTHQIDYTFFFKWQILLLVVITTISLFGLVKAYSLAQNGITKLQNLDFSKILFSMILAALFLNDEITTNEATGAGIILLSIVLSQVNLEGFISRKLSKSAK